MCPLTNTLRRTAGNALETSLTETCTSSDRGVSLRCDELLARPEVRAIMAEFMVRTGLLGQFQVVDPMALGVEKRDEKG